jgi:signal transduction histidine kinase
VAPIDREDLARALDEGIEILLDAQVGGYRIVRIVNYLALFGRPNPLRTRVRLGNVVTSAMRWLPASVGRSATVRDDGKGIDAATMDRIFDPFFTTRDVGHGMGLGLPVCHAIVAAHGGMLTTTSTPDKGSTFRVELPAADTHPGSIAPGARV